MTKHKSDSSQTPTEIRNMVSAGYAKVALNTGASCCGPSCCGGGSTSANDQIATTVGYENDQLDSLPENANLGLGCGNPTALGTLKAGETVVDLGSGAGIDVFLASPLVGPEGKVIGVDMTDDMLELARQNAAEGGYDNVEFRKGVIEALPVEDETVHAIISNCVINLSPEKQKVFAEAYRVLHPGGRLMLSDILLEKELPDAVLQNIDAYIGCVSGAVLRDEYIAMIKAAGFSDVSVERQGGFSQLLSGDDPQVAEAMKGWGVSFEAVKSAADAISSYAITAIK
jgi:arsenite methyltransferase